MMKLDLSKSIFMPLLSKAPLLHLIILTCLFSHVEPLCHPDESLALLEFKDSFIIRRSASDDRLAYPKVASWALKEKDGDCCTWDGVECDENNTHVIALHLNSSCLYGSLTSNSSLFRLSLLQTLDLADNNFNASRIPSQLGNLPRLTYLDLSKSAFAGQIPLEISSLSNLSYLDLSKNNLGLQPDLSALVRLSNLRHLDLSHSSISSVVPGFLANFSNLNALHLDDCGLYREFPSDIFQLPNLQFLGLSENEKLTGSFPEFFTGNRLRELGLGKTSFSGHIPSSIGNLSSLNVLDVTYCRFFGQLPSSLGRLSNLQSLQLNYNNFSGTVDFSMFLNMKNLTYLGLSGNVLSILTEESSIASTANASVPKFESLNLGSCNLTNFPDFLRHQDRLQLLDLSHNHIHGKVPNWIWNTSLVGLDISFNFFTSFGFDVLPSRSLSILHFSGNNFIGALPIPPPSIVLLFGSINEFSGEISPLFFNLSSLKLLDLSYNKLSGMLPECLRNNKHGLSGANVSQECPFGRQLQVMDLSYNKFRGRLPQSLLANCRELRVLKLENNQFNDIFPSWLGTLPKLKLLLLRSNHFNGEITSNSASHFDFPGLEIIDVSHNNLSGLLPSHYFRKWKSMKYFDPTKFSYSGTTITLRLSPKVRIEVSYPYSVIITNKGRDMEYDKILEVFTFIDLSSNRFQGGIPECAGNLRGLQALNLSNNILNGSIPSSLANITRLESLDLSHNELSGKIPQQFVQLTFLASLDVSFNHLIGPIPQGSQFSTFDGSSYEGNSGLWGYPLSSFNTVRPPTSAPVGDEEDGQDSRSWFESNWLTIVPGFVGGLIFGVAIEHVLAVDRRGYWLIRTFDFRVVLKNKVNIGRKLRRKT